VTTLDFAPLGDALLKAPSAVDSYVYWINKLLMFHWNFALVLVLPAAAGKP
jgi:hypothetical protein